MGDANHNPPSTAPPPASPGPWKQIKPVIGLLGGVGAGKSAVAAHFASIGCAVIDADALAKDTLDRPMVCEKLRQWWGDEIIQSESPTQPNPTPDSPAAPVTNGQRHVDRMAIGRIVFQPNQTGQDQLARLEKLIHPLVAAQRGQLMAQYLADDAVVAIVEDCPLLLEKDLAGDCDVLVFVESSGKNRQERVMQYRKWDAEELARRQSRQGSLDMKRKVANYVVRNDASPMQTLVEVRRVLASILAVSPPNPH